MKQILWLGYYHSMRTCIKVSQSQEGWVTPALDGFILRLLFNGFLFRLLIWGHGCGWNRSRALTRTLSCPSFSTMHLQSQRSQQMLLLVLAGAGIMHSTGFLATAQTTNTVPGCRIHGPDMALRGSSDHAHHHLWPIFKVATTSPNRGTSEVPSLPHMNI